LAAAAVAVAAWGQTLVLAVLAVLAAAGVALYSRFNGL
jgi:hypothetical protein